jgi:hypothetical protein
MTSKPSWISFSPNMPMTWTFASYNLLDEDRVIVNNRSVHIALCGEVRTFMLGKRTNVLGKWEQFGDLLVRISGTNLPKIQAGMDARVKAENQEIAPSLQAAAQGRTVKKRRRKGADLVQTT